MRRMSRRSGLSHLAALFFAAVSALPAAAQAPRVTVFEGARLIVGDGSAPIENSAFVVEGNRITQVGRKGQVSVPAGAAHVDLAGKTVIPGIVDAHAHIGLPRCRHRQALEG